MKLFLSLVSVLVFVGIAFGIPAHAQITTIAEINAVDENGSPTFPGLQTTDRYTIEGVALNDIAAFNSADDNSVVLFIQDDTGGVQIYSGAWYNGGASLYPVVKQGDRIRATGLTGFYGGKTNMNDRHNPDQKFEITILDHPGDPEPIEIYNLAAATAFDRSRQTGGEFFQGRLAVLKNVRIIEGEWLGDEILTVADTQGNTIPIQIWHKTNIAESPKPEGLLDITGVFNQEDTEAPYWEGYLVWPRSIDDFKPAATAVDRWDIY